MVYAGSQQERTRLEQVYAEMTEGELRSIAGEATSLTSEAIQALNAEISRRGLGIAVSTWHPANKPASENEFTTEKGLVMLGIFVGVGIALILLVLRFPQWFRGCVRMMLSW